MYFLISDRRDCYLSDPAVRVDIRPSNDVHYRVCFDEYARLQLGAKPTRPTQPLWFVHPVHGITARWSVYVDEPSRPVTEWVFGFKSSQSLRNSSW